MIPPHLFYQIYISFLEQKDCTPPRCGELSEQPQTCFECRLPGHEKKDCPKTQSYASKVLVTQPQPEPEKKREPKSDLNTTPGSSLSEEETTDATSRRKERREKKDKKDRKERKEKKKSSKPAMACTAEGKRKGAPSPEVKSTPAPTGRHPTAGHTGIQTTKTMNTMTRITNGLRARPTDKPRKRITMMNWNRPWITRPPNPFFTLVTRRSINVTLCALCQVSNCL